MKKQIILKDKEGNIINTGKTYRDAARELGVTAQLVNYICVGRVKNSYKVKGQLSVVFFEEEEKDNK